MKECTENIDEKEINLAKFHSEVTSRPACSSCTTYIILFFIFTINIRISTYFVYYKYMNHDKKQLLKKALLFLKQQFTKDKNGKYDINKN